jgi:hypothetical protein
MERLGHGAGEASRSGKSLGKGSLGKAERQAMRPGACRAYIRRRLASEFAGIVDGFVKEAKSGSVPHLKLATELLKPVRKGTTRKKGETMRALDKLLKNRAAKAEARAQVGGEPEGRAEGCAEGCTEEARDVC